MRKVLITLTAAGAALAFATPAAAAQYYPQPSYGAPYGNAYGYNNYGHVRALQVRIDSVQRQIENLRARRLISRNEAKDLRSESRDLERRLFRRGSNGLNPREAQDIQIRIARLEQHVRHEVRDGRNWRRGDAYNGWIDRDRDGRNDRYEDDRGRRHD